MANPSPSFGTHGVILEGAKSRVLLAEDDSAFRSTMSLLLRSDGYDVVEVGDGGDALDELVRSLSDESSLRIFDVIITDVRMPGFSGMDVLRAVRGLPEAPPVILMTAFGNKETHREAHRLGALTVLDKPFDLDDLRTAVADALSQRMLSETDEGSDEPRS
ncbi:MAG TPA: response regulator [Polyangiaceae bacterium]|nr:response regulator [Polyangiaceae bacterium]